MLLALQLCAHITACCCGPLWLLQGRVLQLHCRCLLQSIPPVNCRLPAASMPGLCFSGAQGHDTPPLVAAAALGQTNNGVRLWRPASRGRAEIVFNY